MIRFSDMVRDVMCMAGVAAFAPGVHAQTHYPTKPVRIVVPYFPGSPSDICARMLGQKFSESLSKPVVIENVAGASGNIGTERVARANPDGYSLMLPGNAPLSSASFRRHAQARECIYQAGKANYNRYENRTKR